MPRRRIATSHFPAFDRLEQVLLNWTELFAEPPVATQPLAVQGDAVIVLCADERWRTEIAARHDELVQRLRDRVTGDLRLELRRIVPVPATATELFLARQLVVVQGKLRDVELGF